MAEIDYRAQFDLTGRTAVVTGGAGLLGREFCVGLAQQGARVAIVDIDRNGAEALRTAIIDCYGGESIAIAADLCDPCAAKAAVARVVETWGGLDILVNNMQSTTPDPKAYFAHFEDYDVAEWRRVLAVDLDAMAIMAQCVCQHMTKRGQGGSLIHTGSIYGHYGPDNRIYDGAAYKGTAINNPAVYSVGKAAVAGLTRWLATTYAPYGIRSNAVVPGGIESGQNPTFVQRYSDRVPMGRMARKEEIVGAVIWLASPASSYVTGQFIFVDGGLSAW